MLTGQCGKSAFLKKMIASGPPCDRRPGISVTLFRPIRLLSRLFKLTSPLETACYDTISRPITLLLEFPPKVEF